MSENINTQTRSQRLAGQSQVEKLGVRISGGAKTITIEGPSFGDLVLLEHLRTENLQRCVAALQQASPQGADDLVDEVQAQLLAMAGASSSTLQELLRVAYEQGLRFEIVPTPGEVH